MYHLRVFALIVGTWGSLTTLAGAPSLTTASEPVALPPPQDLPSRLCAAMSLEDRVAQLVMSYPMVDRKRPVNVGGVIVVGSLLHSEKKLRARIAGLQARARVPLLVAVDMEGGQMNRLRAVSGLASVPSGRELGRMSEKEVQAWGRRIGAGMRSVGFNCSLGPVLDLADRGLMYESGRSMGADPNAVARLGRAFAMGLIQEGVLPIGKHFPGYGPLGANSDHTLIIARRSPQEIAEQSVPFVAAGDLLAGVMLANVGFEAYDGVPAIFSPKLLASAHLNGWMTVTDDLAIPILAEAAGGSPEEVIRRAFLAGNDILLTTSPVDWGKSIDARKVLLELVRGNPELERQLDASVLRVLRVKERAGLLERFRNTVWSMPAQRAERAPSRMQ